MPETPITNESDNPTSRLISVLSGNVICAGAPWTIEYFGYLMTRVDSSDSYITCDRVLPSTPITFLSALKNYCGSQEIADVVQ